MAGNAFLNYINGVITMVRGVQVGGVANANAIPALNSNGQFDITMMPTGVGPDTVLLPATQALTAGQFVNIYNSGTMASPVFSVQPADATAVGKPAHGFVLANVANNGSATVYLNGNNTSITGAAPGQAWLGTAGGYTQTAPAFGTLAVAQSLGVATSATSINFTLAPPITLA